VTGWCRIRHLTRLWRVSRFHIFLGKRKKVKKKINFSPGVSLAPLWENYQHKDSDSGSKHMAEWAVATPLPPMCGGGGGGSEEL